ncbi:MAG: UxaA family hydrolase [Vicinamibacterales bacterium]
MSPVAALVISPRDNVATVLEPLEAGQTIVMSGQSITVLEPTPRGHKIALRLIRKGEEVLKYGSSIGTATGDIQPGAHVHTHNVASGRGRGDLAPRMDTDQHRSETTSAEGPRIAEPPDRSPVTGKTVQ